MCTWPTDSEKKILHSSLDSGRLELEVAVHAHRSCREHLQEANERVSSLAVLLSDEVAVIRSKVKKENHLQVPASDCNRAISRSRLEHDNLHTLMRLLLHFVSSTNY